MSQKQKNVVIVFGATGAVGRDVVKLLVEQPVFAGLKQIKVVGVGLEDVKCKELEKDFKIHTTTVDANDAKQVKEVFDMHKDEGICGVINTIDDYFYKPMQDITGEEVMKVVQQNVLGSFNILKQASHVLAQGGGGSIVCIGSSIAHYGLKHHEAWAAAKGAVEAMHRSAASTYAPHNVRINCIAAGLIKSPESAEITGNEQRFKKTIEIYPLRRIAEPLEVAHACVFLLHPNSSFIMGAALPVDGGLSLVHKSDISSHI